MLSSNLQYSILYNVLLLIVICSFGENYNKRNVFTRGGVKGGMLLLFMVSIIAFRDWASPGFGDSAAYGKFFQFADTPQSVWYAKSKFFGYLYYYWHLYGLSPEFFFWVSACFYCLPMFFFSREIAKPYDAYFVLIFFACSFGWYSFGVNGIRNGWAIAMLTWGLWAIYKGNKIVACLALIFAWCIHGSSMITIAGVVGAAFYSKPKSAFKLWILCLLLSLVLGNTIQGLFNTIGFVRSDGGGYLESSLLDTSSAVAIGGVFRWDFVLFSICPILWGLYSLKKKRENDKYTVYYKFLLCTYIYANAIWILAIRAAYTNRIAQLSWWMIPLVLVFPIVRMNVFPKQSHEWALVLASCYSFTYMMYIIS